MVLLMFKGQVKQEVEESQVAQLTSHDAHRSTPLSKYLDMQLQRKVEELNYLKFAELHDEQLLPF